VPCYNPAFDVTPARLLAGIITERGIVRPVNAEGIQKTLSAPLPVAKTLLQR
jgi:methylthioribose-1-phosphate isomerase